MNRVLKGFTAVSVTAVAVLSLVGCHIGTTKIEYKNADKYTVGAGKVDGAVKELEINWISGSITVEYGDVEEITYTETSKKDLKSEEWSWLQMRTRYEGETLIIQPCETGWRKLKDVEKSLTVTVPQNGEITTFTVNSVSATVDVSALCGNITVDTVSGNVSVTGQTDVKKLEVNAVSAEVSVTADSVEKMNVNTVSGNLEVNVSDLKDFSANCVSANVAINFDRDHGYYCEFSSVSGDFRSNAEYEKKDKRYTYGDKSAVVDVDTVSGNLTVNIQ